MATCSDRSITLALLRGTTGDCLSRRERRTSPRVRVADRRRFLKEAAQGAVAGAVATLWRATPDAQAGPAPSDEGRKIKYVGWEEGITYQAPDPEDSTAPT